MGRLLGIDYGLKRCGIAVTDPLRIFASGLTTVPTVGLFEFLQTYLGEEKVDMIVLGLPFHESGDPGQLYEVIQEVGAKIKVKFPEVELHYLDERYTSRMAREIILQSGANRKKRQDKGLIDKVSAGIILQEFLELIEKENRV